MDAASLDAALPEDEVRPSDPLLFSDPVPPSGVASSADAVVEASPAVTASATAVDPRAVAAAGSPATTVVAAQSDPVETVQSAIAGAGPGGAGTLPAATGLSASEPSTLLAGPPRPTIENVLAGASTGSASVPTADASAAADRTPVAVPTTASAPSVPAVLAAGIPRAAPVVSAAAEIDAAAPRSVAAQVAPVVVSIAQRPAGTHQLTMTVNPDSLGPVTVRAQIGLGGDVQVELLGATDAGREALRTIVADLRRDLASVMPNATLSVAQGAATDAGADRGGQPGAGTAGDRGSDAREHGRSASDHPQTAERGRDIPTLDPRTGAAVGGLDIFA